MILIFVSIDEEIAIKSTRAAGVGDKKNKLNMSRLSKGLSQAFWTFHKYF